MLTDWAVLARVAPICSAIDMNRLLKISSITGSAWVPTAWRSGRGHDAGQHEIVAGGDLALPARSR